MTSVCYFIVCINLFYSFVQAEIISPSTTSNVQEEEQELFLNSITAENQDEYLAKTVTPYWNLTSNEQLEKKQNTCSDIIDMMVKQSENLKNLMTYKILPIVPSPVTKAYRNSDEFFIKRGVDGNPKTVGCVVGKLSLGSALSIHPTKIVTIKESHKRVAQVYEDFIRLCTVPATIKPNEFGIWNRLLVRSNEVGDVLVCVTVTSKGYTYKMIMEQQESLKEYFYKHLPNISLFHQVCPMRRCTHDIAPFVLLYGKPYILETLSGYNFQITPESFFPVNKLGSEVLYDTVIRKAKLKPNTTVLDICSGTGTNSIVLSKFVREVFGFETVAPAVKVAKYIAKINNIQNVKFLEGRLNNQLNAVVRSLNASSDVVAILNHRRKGVGLEAISTIRSSYKISKLLYFFYKSDSQQAVQNFIALCSYENFKLPPFKLTKVIAFDLLPQTTYVEMVLMFQRQLRANI